MEVSQETSCPARGMGVEIAVMLFLPGSMSSCPPRGKGVEIFLNPTKFKPTNSRPARGMGVEIGVDINGMAAITRHAPRGAWE